MNKSLSPSSPTLNATVMASAGTGKTYLLVTRLVRLLLAGARPDAILAITFTRKAAAEMQTRLAERLFSLASLNEEELVSRLREMDIAPEATTLERARRLYESLLQSRQSVRTTTFHAFCQEILLRFPLEADVPPGFELIDSGAEISSAAWSAMLADAGSMPNSPLAASLQRLMDYCGGLHNLQRALDSFLAHRGDWWAYTEESEAPDTFALEQLQHQLQIEPNSDPLQGFFTTKRMDELAEFTALLAKHPNKGNNEALDALATARHTEIPPVERFDACRAAFLTRQNAPRARKASKAQAQSMGADGEERFLELHVAISQKLIETLEQLAAHETYRACADWYLAGTQLLQHFQRIKSEQRFLDFTDLEWRAYRLLTGSDNAQWVQYKLDQRIDHLLVDEFQDTNPTQWRLLLPLLQEMAASRDDKARSVFLVGDAKQSIYRFRRAEPRLFQTAHDWLSEHVEAQGFPLHISWRSAPAIMQGINKVFGEHGPMACQLRDFTDHDTHHQTLWGSITVLPLIEEIDNEESDSLPDNLVLRNPLQQPRELPVDDRYTREGLQIANTIRQLIDDRILIGPADKAHPISYGDIMLLVRSRSHVGYYEQALREAGIPYIGAERGTLLESLEVGDMVALLELLITPYNNLSLATVLRSPLFACSDEDLQLLAQSGTGNWFQRLQETAAKLPPDHPLVLAAHQLETWRSLAGKLPIHDLLDRIFCEGNVLARYQSAFPEHLRKRSEANLVRFLELALEIDSGRYPSLSHFLYRLGELRENRDEAPDEAPVSGNADRVCILTIHAAKGLEAPVVFLADCAASSGNDKPFRAQVSWPANAPHPEQFLLVGKQGQQPPLVKVSLEHEKNEEQREAANLLYVAITRARQLLYVSGVKPRKGDELGWYGAMRKGLDPLEQVPLGESVTISSNTMPEQETKRVAAKAKSPITIPPALSERLREPPQPFEIAPSYQSDTALPTEGSVDEDGRLRGQVVHRLLERFTEKSDKDVPNVISEVAAEFSFSTSSYRYRSWVAECESLLSDPEMASIFNPEAGVEAMNEVPIIYTHNGSTVHGIIDRLLLFPDEAWIVDYKSHQQATPDNIGVLAANYRQQLGYYAAGVQRLWPNRRIRGFLLFTQPHHLHEVDLAAVAIA